MWPKEFLKPEFRLENVTDHLTKYKTVQANNKIVLWFLKFNNFMVVFQALEEKERKASSHRENLLREQRYLRRRLELLSTQVDAIHKRRSVSECSTSTVSSTHSSHSESGKQIILTFWHLNTWEETLDEPSRKSASALIIKPFSS